MATKDKVDIKPLFDNVLIKPLDAEEKTASGIVLPDSAKEKPQVGLVMAIGTGHVSPEGKVRPISVRPGQKVMYKNEHFICLLFVVASDRMEKNPFKSDGMSNSQLWRSVICFRKEMRI